MSDSDASGRKSKRKRAKYDRHELPPLASTSGSSTPSLPPSRITVGRQDDTGTRKGAGATGRKGGPRVSVSSQMLKLTSTSFNFPPSLPRPLPVQATTTSSSQQPRPLLLNRHEARLVASQPLFQRDRTLPSVPPSLIKVNEKPLPSSQQHQQTRKQEEEVVRTDSRNETTANSNIVWLSSDDEADQHEAEGPIGPKRVVTIEKSNKRDRPAAIDLQPPLPDLDLESESTRPRPIASRRPLLAHAARKSAPTPPYYKAPRKRLAPNAARKSAPSHLDQLQRLDSVDPLSEDETDVHARSFQRGSATTQGDSTSAASLPPPAVESREGGPSTLERIPEESRRFEPLARVPVWAIRKTAPPPRRRRRRGARKSTSWVDSSSEDDSTTDLAPPIPRPTSPSHDERNPSPSRPAAELVVDLQDIHSPAPEPSDLDNTVKAPETSQQLDPPTAPDQATTLPEEPQTNRSIPTSFKPIPPASFHSHSSTSILSASTSATTLNDDERRTTDQSPKGFARSDTSPSPPLSALTALTEEDLLAQDTTTKETSAVTAQEDESGGGRGGGEDVRMRMEEETSVVVEQPPNPDLTLPHPTLPDPSLSNPPPVSRENHWLGLEAQKFFPKEFETVGTSERMLRKRSLNGSVIVVEKPAEVSPELSDVRGGDEKNEERRKAKEGEKESWVNWLRIDQGPRVETPSSYAPPPHYWHVQDPEDTINDCIHHKQVLYTLDKLVVNTKSHKLKDDDFPKATLTLRLDTETTIHGFPPTLTLASRSIPYPLIRSPSSSSKPIRKNKSKLTLIPDPSHPLFSKPFSLAFDPKICRKAGSISIVLCLSLQLDETTFETSYDLCSVSSPIDPLVPRSGAPFLHFDRSKPKYGMKVTIDIVPSRKQITSPEEARLEIERRFAKLDLDDTGVWIPDAQAMRKDGPEVSKVKMIDLGRDGKYGYDFITKLPYRTNEVVRDFHHDFPEVTAHWIKTQDDAISRTTNSPQEKLLARVHMRWCLLNPYPPATIERELTCWIYNAPLVHHFSLRFDLARFLLTVHLKHRLLTESEIRRVLVAYDKEREKIEKGKRRNYEDLRREAMWVKEPSS
ncbi:uncharacterized protein JCM6883_005063 [Sporobolomyces salmoneus]|uniref:uncharacterized protein n=1 Tax=Sporobolomyces salmoneus TaxID=183962 RepID=UPI003182534A